MMNFRPASLGSGVFVNGRKISVSPRQIVGTGGEADVYDIGHGQALKLFKAPDHPDFADNSEASQAARLRLEEQQHKLPRFPHGLPTNIIAPDAVATSDMRGGRIVGYTMPLLHDGEVLLRYGDRAFRDASGITHGHVTQLFRRLLDTVVQVHAAGVVVGDFNDLNVLVGSAGDAHLIDADSFQFGGYLCHTFTSRFLDPLLCDASANVLAPCRPHATGSDWYAFCVMLMQSLLYVDPYGGLYRPADPARRIGHNQRPFQRITVFHPEVRYPKPAIPFSMLPDDLLHFLHEVFTADRREAFPPHLLDNLQWSTCKHCGAEFARPHCPRCTPDLVAAEAAVKKSIRVRGHVTATRVCRTNGVVLFAGHQDGTLRYLLHEDGAYKREDGTVVAQGELRLRTAYATRGEDTIIGRDGQLITVRRQGDPARLSVDSYRGVPVFATDGTRLFWLQSGQLWRQAPLGAQYIGDVLSDQTLFWCGPTFGFGYYRAGNLHSAFVFDTQKGGLNDAVQLPPLHGQMYNATCLFTSSHCWFLLALQENGHLVHRAFAVNSHGVVEATAQAGTSDGTWLGCPLTGKCAGGAGLLVPTDNGIVRLELQEGSPGKLEMTVSQTYPDTEPFVHAGNVLISGPDGVYVVGRQEIHLLQMKTI